MPSQAAPDVVRNVALLFERGYPHSLRVNLLRKRFANDAISYHQFRKAMIRDNVAGAANILCWKLFDVKFRGKYRLGGLLPGWAMPDWMLPRDWFDNFLYRADNVLELAAKTGLPVAALQQTIATFNAGALKGEDGEFGRGETVYNRHFGDPNHKPHRNLGTLAKAPLYAEWIDLGDIGSKGGLKTDFEARVLREDGGAIGGLYAIGNCVGSVIGPVYPGGGATLGSAMTFVYLAAANIAHSNGPPMLAETGRMMTAAE